MGWEASLSIEVSVLSFLPSAGEQVGVGKVRSGTSVPDDRWKKDNKFYEGHVILLLKPDKGSTKKQANNKCNDPYFSGT